MDESGILIKKKIGINVSFISMSWKVEEYDPALSVKLMLSYTTEISV